MALPKSMQAPNGFLFPQVEGRPFRAISVETEVDGPGNTVAYELYTCGIVGASRVQSYGSHPGTDHPHVAFMKTDSSVTAGEVVFDRIYLTNPLHAKAFNRAMERLRVMEKRGIVAYNPNCGGHIHVDASGYGFYDLLRLMTEFGYLEEPIFRLAGAGKQYGHRSLYRGYDAAHAGRGYSNPVQKGPFTDPVLAMGLFRRQHRNSGLNITKYLQSRCQSKNCVQMPIKEGDAIEDPRLEDAFQTWLRRYTREYGAAPTQQTQLEEREYMAVTLRGKVELDSKLCTCSKQQHTIEWRVWNSQSNPRIMFAWIALMQALHAYCWRPVESQEYRSHIYKDALGWERRPFDGSDLDYLRRSQERVEFIFGELPLLPEEKDALAYAFMRTPYKVWGKPFFARLANQPYKAPPVSNDYSGIPNREISELPEERMNDDEKKVESLLEDQIQEYSRTMPMRVEYRAVPGSITIGNTSSSDVPVMPSWTARVTPTTEYPDDEEVPF